MASIAYKDGGKPLTLFDKVLIAPFLLNPLSDFRNTVPCSVVVFIQSTHPQLYLLSYLNFTFLSVLKCETILSFCISRSGNTTWLAVMVMAPIQR